MTSECKIWGLILDWVMEILLLDKVYYTCVTRHSVIEIGTNSSSEGGKPMTHWHPVSGNRNTQQCFF